MPRDDRAYARELLSGDHPAKQGNQEPIFALFADPLGESAVRDELKTNSQVEIVGAQQQIFLERRDFRARGKFDQHAQSECVVNDSLANVEDSHIVGRQNAGERTGEAGFILARNIDQVDLGHQTFEVLLLD